MHEDLKKPACKTTNKRKEVISAAQKSGITVKDATKLSREFMLVSHKSYLSLVSSAASCT